MRSKQCLSLLVAYALMVLSSFGYAQTVLDFTPNLNFSAKPPAVSDPAGFFSAVIPQQYFTCTVEAKSVKCVGLLRVRATLSILVQDVPETASAALIALNSLEHYEKQPHFKLIKNTPTSVDGVQSIVQAFTYDELSNVDRPVWIQILNAVQGAKLVVVQVQCASRTCVEYGAAVDQVFNTLKIAPLDKRGQPIKGKLAPAQPESADKKLDSIVKDLEF